MMNIILCIGMGLILAIFCLFGLAIANSDDDPGDVIAQLANSLRVIFFTTPWLIALLLAAHALQREEGGKFCFGPFGQWVLKHAIRDIEEIQDSEIAFSPSVQHKQQVFLEYLRWWKRGGCMAERNQRWLATMNTINDRKVFRE